MKTLFIVIEDDTCALIGVYGDRETAEFKAEEYGGGVIEIGVTADGKTVNINGVYADDMADIPYCL